MFCKYLWTKSKIMLPESPVKESAKPVEQTMPQPPQDALGGSNTDVISQILQERNEHRKKENPISEAQPDTIVTDPVKGPDEVPKPPTPAPDPQPAAPPENITTQRTTEKEPVEVEEGDESDFFGLNTEKQEKPADAKEARLAELEEIMKDPLVELVVEARRSGKNPMEVLSQFKSVDVNAMEGEDLVKMDCQEMGITDPDQIEEEVATFRAKTPREQRAETIQLRTKLSNQLSERNKKVSQSLKSTSETVKEVFTNYANEATEMANNMIGKKFYGRVVTEKDAEAIKFEALNNFAITRPDGSLDAKKILYYVTATMFGTKGLKAKVDSEKAKATEAILKEVTQPDKMLSATNVIRPTGKITKDDLINKITGNE